MTGIAQRRSLGIWGPRDYAVQLAGATLTSGRVHLGQFMNGWLRGCVGSDVAGTLTITQQAIPGSGGLTITVPVDATVAGENFNYPFYVGLFMPYVTVNFVVGAAPTTILRVQVTAVPET